MHTATVTKDLGARLKFGGAIAPPPAQRKTAPEFAVIVSGHFRF